MNKVAVVTDSNSGITQTQAEQLGIRVLPMPFYIDDVMYYEDINLSQEQFYEKLAAGANISTSQPLVANVLELWDELLQTHGQVVHIPMSSGLSGSCETAMALAQGKKYLGRVEVVNNQRISVTQKQSVLEALDMARQGKTATEIKKILEDSKYDSSIYIMVDTLYYLKKGGRITPAAAAIGTLLKLKPVLQIQGEKLDAFAKARSVKQAKNVMIHAIQHDFTERFGTDAQGTGMHLQMAYTGDRQEADLFRQEVQQIFPRQEIVMDSLSLSVSCHIGPGALAIACTKIL